MKEPEETFDRIEHYIKGKMSLEEKLVFEKELATNPQLKEQLEYSQTVDHFVIAGEAMKLKEQMRKDLYKPKPKNKLYALSAFIFLTVVIGLYFLLVENKVQQPLLQTPAIPALRKEIKSKELKSIKSKSIQDSSNAGQIIQKKRISSNSDPSLPKIEEVSNKPNKKEMEKYINTTAPLNDKPNNIGQLFTTVTPTKDLCADFIGSVDFNTKPSCSGQETGEIYLKAETIKGGQAPYTFQLGERSAEHFFSHLPPGHYTLLIKDANNCVVQNKRKVIIETQNCTPKRQYVFNMEYDAAWPIPYIEGKEAVHFKIQDKSGKLFYQSTVIGTQPEAWGGDSNTGMPPALGLYFFSIEYADGSVDEGNITLTR